jgi:hypothetical protein
MSQRWRRLDPCGHLPAPFLLQAWLGSLLGLHVVFALFALGFGRVWELAILAAMAGGLGLALWLSHPAAKLALLGAWAGWWTLRFALWPGVHLGVVLMLVTSLYVAVRVAWAWRREGVDAGRIGWGVPPDPAATWPELAGLTEGERRLVLRRAARELPRPRLFTVRTLSIFLAGMAVVGLELVLLPSPASGTTGVALPQSGLWLWAIAGIVVASIDPREQEAILRRALRERVLPKFWQQPWHWDRARREAHGGTGSAPSPHAAR